MALRRFVIERDIPKVGSFERQQLREAAAKSNEVLHRLASRETVPRRKRPGSAPCECAMLWVQVWTVLAHGAWQVN
jgi:hypothetical protein